MEEKKTKMKGNETICYAGFYLSYEKVKCRDKIIFLNKMSLNVLTISLIFIKILFISFSYFFFLSGFSITDTNDSQNSVGREETIFYSILPLPPAHEHWDIYLQLCIWDDYHVFLMATLVFTRLLLDEIYHLIE